jgi:diaminopimelate decarboxylase
MALSSFAYVDDVLHCDDTDLRGIADAVGTPFYCYSERALLSHARALDAAFGEHPHLVCYAVKANGNLALLELFAREGLGADIISGGELFRARRAGIPAEKIVYSGLGKTEDEIAAALDEGILAFNIESEAELETINRAATRMGLRAPITFRVNPEVDPRTHKYISTGLRESKFGIPQERAMASYQRASVLSGIEVVGVDAHIGSQMTETGPIAESASVLAKLVTALRAEGLPIRYVDVGGGLGIRYRDEAPPTPGAWAEAILPALGELDVTLIFEPGRSMTGNAGVLVTRILDVKRTPAKTFVVTDAAMNDLLRPSLYGAEHAIREVERSSRAPEVVDVVGPVCESGDFLARGRELPGVREGELLAVMGAGAYGFVMASNYNARPRPPEVLVRDNGPRLVRARETYEDLVRGEASLDAAPALAVGS